MKAARPNLAARNVIAALAIASFALMGASRSFADGDDPPSRVARLAHIEGQMSIQPSGVDQWSQASSNYPIATGDRVYADTDGRAEISAGDVVARIGHSTDLTMTNLTDQMVQLGLAQGTLRIHTYVVDAYNQVEIDTPNGAVVVTQPGDIRVDSYSGDDGTIVTVNTGAIQISGPDLQQDIAAGQSVRLQGSNPIEISANDMPATDDFDTWCLARDRHSQNSQTAQYVNRDAVGSEDLDAYGSWSQTPDYGPVWYPQQIDADWAPYREGHWVWTGPWGWAWVDDEPWGYAPFHYGRWVQIDSRWGWMPGPVEARPVWSPALVAFVGGGGFSIGIGVQAWFPLGPGEPYYPWYHCSPSYQQRVNVTNVNITVIHNTTIINNYNVFLRNPQDTSHLDSVHYANRAVAVTAMRQTDFASAHSARTAMVHVDPAQLQHAQVVARVDVPHTSRSYAAQPSAHAVPVTAARPTLLTRGGREMQATPGARPQPVPYKAAPPVRSDARVIGRSGSPSPGSPNLGQNGTRPGTPQNPSTYNSGRDSSRPAGTSQPPYARPAQPATPDSNARPQEPNARPDTNPRPVNPTPEDRRVPPAETPRTEEPPARQPGQPEARPPAPDREPPPAKPAPKKKPEKEDKPAKDKDKEPQ